MPRNIVIIHSEKASRVLDKICAMRFHCSNVFRVAKLYLFFIVSKFFYDFFKDFFVMHI